MAVDKKKSSHLPNLEQEKAIKAVLDGLPFYVLLIDENHRIVLANKAMEELLGKKLAEIRGGYCPTIVHGTPDPYPGCPLEEAVAKKKCVEREMYNPERDIWVLSVVYPTNIKTSEGKDIYYHATRNITVEKRAEEGLKKAELTFRNFIDFTYDWEYWVSSDDKSVIYTSPSCERITGHTAEEFIEDPTLLSNIVYPEDKDMYEEHIKETQTGSACNGRFDFRIITKSGEMSWLAHVCQEVVDENGLSMGRRVSSRDVTARKEMEEEVIRSEKQLRQIIDLVPQMIFANDWDGKFIMANEATAKAYNSTPSELLGKNLADVHKNKRELKRMLEDNREVMSEGQAKFIERTPFTDASGTRHTMQKTKMPYRYIGKEGEQTYAVLGVSVDTSELVQAIKEKDAFLKKTQEMLSETINTISAMGEIREP